MPLCTGGGGEGMLWEEAALPMSWYIVLEITTRSMTTEPRRLLGEEQPACGAVILRFHGVSSQ